MSEHATATFRLPNRLADPKNLVVPVFGRFGDVVRVDEPLNRGPLS